MGKNEYRLLWSKLKIAIFMLIFILIGLFVFGKPNLNIFESAGAIFVGILSGIIFYYTTRKNMEGTDVSLSRVGNPITIAEQHVNGYLFILLFFYIFFFAEGYARKVFWLGALAFFPLSFGQFLISVFLERKIGQRIVVTRPEGQNILTFLYALTFVGFMTIAIFNETFYDLLKN